MSTAIATAAPPPEAAPVDTVRTLLRREVADILHQHVPALALVPRDKVYDRVLDDPIVCEQAFRLLRSRPELFKDVVVTKERLFPTNDFDPLWCGRTLAEVVALVVRACARRYFRRRLPAPRPTRPTVTAKPGLLARMAIGLGLAEPPKPRRPVRREPPGETLYQAMRDLLLYDWQVPLIPAYAALTPKAVKALGPKLLELRDPLKLQIIADHGNEGAVVEGKTPLLMSNAERLLTASSDSINAEVLWSVCQKMRMGAIFPGLDTNEMRKAVSLVAATSPQALKLFLPVLGDDICRFTLYLFTAYGTFGPTRYRQVMGAGGQTWVLEAMARRVASEKPLNGTYGQMKLTIEGWLSTAVEALDRADAQRAETHQQLDSMKTE